MKILVASDSHGLALHLIDAIRKENPEKLFFLGDGIRDLLQVRIYFPHLLIEQVRGNCDHWSDGTEERLLQIEGHSILMLHGHTRGVKRGINKLRVLAQKLDAKVVLYGHTHRPTYIEENGVSFLNPGSIGGFGYASYGILEITESIHCQLVTL